MSGPRLGRPGKNHAEEILQELLELGERNAVEGKFGNGKRKIGLTLIMAKLQITTGSMIGMDIFILNMEKKMRQSTSLICAFLDILMSRLYPCGKRLTATIISGDYAAV